MASWAIERRMSIPPTTLSELRIREAKSLLAWSAHFEDRTTPNLTHAEFEEERLRPVRETGRGHRH